MAKKLDVNYFPRWTRRSLTFTIDDGNVAMDQKFLSILRPHGILGTFNLCSHMLSALDADGYREFYRGYEIANHCKKHPYALSDDKEYLFSDEEFQADTADVSKTYKADEAGCFWIHYPNGWRIAADTDTYIRLADEGRSDLEALFGKGSVKSYVWPYHEQQNEKVKAHLRASGYYAIRKTGSVRDTTGFAAPSDRMAWSYNADHTLLLSEMEKYEACPDNGELKFFAFGVHSVDWERADRWNDLVRFAEKYGDRPDDYYYATVGDIFAYEDAVKALEISESAIYNPSDITVYIKLDGERTVIPPKAKLAI